MSGFWIQDDDGVSTTSTIAGPLGRAADAASVSVALSTEDVAILNSVLTQALFIAALKSSTATHSSVNSAATSTTILASNANRKGARIFNTDANALYLDLSGGTAVAASRAQVSLATNTGYDVPAGYTGLITGIWAADGSGVASVVEFTA